MDIEQKPWKDMNTLEKVFYPLFYIETGHNKTLGRIFGIISGPMIVFGFLKVYYDITFTIPEMIQIGIPIVLLEWIIGKYIIKWRWIQIENDFYTKLNPTMMRIEKNTEVPTCDKNDTKMQTTDGHGAMSKKIRTSKQKLKK